jgi:dihydrofolate synthase/folylpolyglutamate synthase
MAQRTGDYRSALQLIRERSDYDRGFITNPRSGPSGPALGLVRTRALLDDLSSPDRAHPIVHVAGSKGKGSTSAFVAGIGNAAGYRTGLSTSPHLHSFRERIAIDGAPVSESRFAALAFETAAAIQRLEEQRPELGMVTAFELLTVMALLAFAEVSCDLAVVEVGLGGTYDATNVVTPVVSVITRLDLEHTQILGDTIESIATNKAGIIKRGVPVITAAQDPAALNVIEATAAAQGALLIVAERDFVTEGTWRKFSWSGQGHRLDHIRAGMAGPHQMENAALAIAAWTCLDQRGIAASDENIRAGIGSTSLPGRFERASLDGRTWILDGAHTPVAAATLAVEVLSEFGAPIPAIVGLLNDKHPAEFFGALAPCISEAILTEPNNPRALPVSELVPIANTAISQVTASMDLETSLQEARARTGAETPVLITGSLALVAEARELLHLAVADPIPPDSTIPANLRSIVIG